MELARYVQEECKEYTHVTRQSLSDILKSYRNHLPPAMFIAKRMPQSFEKAAETVRKGIDELAELEKLYELQMRRIGIDENTEKKINKLMPTMTQEVRVAAEILGRIATLKQDLGLSEHHLGKLELEAKLHTEVEGKYGSQAVIAVISDPQKRRKVLGLAERLLASSNKSKEDPELDDNLNEIIDTDGSEAEDLEASLTVEADGVEPDEAADAEDDREFEEDSA
jgi:hypothetical protein